MEVRLEPMGVVMGITAYLSKISHYISALEAVQYEKHELLSNQFISLAAESMARQLTMDLCRIFDREKTMGFTNCCVETLEKVCLDCNSLFPNGESDELISEMKALREEFESAIKRETRNKKLAHSDYQELWSFHFVEIEFEKEKQLYLHTVDVLKKVIRRFEWDENIFCIHLEEGNSINYVDELNKLSHKKD